MPGQWQKVKEYGILGLLVLVWGSVFLGAIFGGREPHIHIFWLFVVIWLGFYCLRAYYKGPYDDLLYRKSHGTYRGQEDDKALASAESRYRVVNALHLVAAALAIMAGLSECGKTHYSEPPPDDLMWPR